MDKEKIPSCSNSALVTKEKQEVHPQDNFYWILVQGGQKLKTIATIQNNLNAML